ncbi:MAG: ATP phosphoribosyltransferase regulatory subunit [Eubacteriales bacterium]
MNINDFKYDEKITFALRSLYREYGYTQFKMSKFEEYDFYSRHKEFLVSDRVLTFTDTGGKLMALKPDVTLSIIKNSKGMDNTPVKRFCYNENVYRVSDKTHNFSEIMQSGLECIGEITALNLLEVTWLAALSLKCISPESVLVLSHLGVLSELLGGVRGEERDGIIAQIDRKNTAAVRSIAERLGLAEKKTALLCEISSPSFSAAGVDEVISRVRAMTQDEIILASLAELESVAKNLKKSGVKVTVDFSLVSDMSYYNGIIMRGYVKGVPTSVLSGGQYDKLMEKMGSPSRAVGFAVYLDSLELIEGDMPEYDADVLLLYSPDDDPAAVLEKINSLTAEGKRVAAQVSVPEKLSFKEIQKF